MLTKLTYLTRLRGVGLTPTEHTVLVTLLTYARKDMTNARPGWARLAADTDLDVSTVKRATKRLTERGFLVLTEMGGNLVGHGRANVYMLTLPSALRIDPSSTRGAGVDPFGGDEGGRPRTPKGGTGAREGGHGRLGRGAPAPPHQGSTSSGPNVIIPDAKHPGPASAGREHHPDDEALWRDRAMRTTWSRMLDDYDELEAWLDSDIGLQADEPSTALGMWEDGRHPVAIRNTILRRRAA